MGGVSAIERNRYDGGRRAAIPQRRRILPIRQNRRHLRLPHAFGHSPLSGIRAERRRRGGDRIPRRRNGAENDRACDSLEGEKSKNGMDQRERRQSEPGVREMDVAAPQSQRKLRRRSERHAAEAE